MPATRQMFTMPSLITMSICATRMYRSLAEFGSTDVIESAESPQRIGRTAADVNFPTTTSTPPNQTELPVHLSYEPWQYPSSQTDQYVSAIGTEGQPREKPPGLSFDNDMRATWRHESLRETSHLHDPES